MNDAAKRLCLIVYRKDRRAPCQRRQKEILWFQGSGQHRPHFKSSFLLSMFDKPPPRSPSMNTRPGHFASACPVYRPIRYRSLRYVLKSKKPFCIPMCNLRLVGAA